MQRAHHHQRAAAGAAAAGRHGLPRTQASSSSSSAAGARHCRREHRGRWRRRLPAHARPLRGPAAGAAAASGTCCCVERVKACHVRQALVVDERTQRVNRAAPQPPHAATLPLLLVVLRGQRRQQAVAVGGLLGQQRCHLIHRQQRTAAASSAAAARPWRVRVADGGTQRCVQGGRCCAVCWGGAALQAQQHLVAGSCGCVGGCVGGCSAGSSSSSSSSSATLSTAVVARSASTQHTAPCGSPHCSATLLPSPPPAAAAAAAVPAAAPAALSAAACISPRRLVCASASPGSSAGMDAYALTHVRAGGGTRWKGGGGACDHAADLQGAAKLHSQLAPSTTRTQHTHPVHARTPVHTHTHTHTRARTCTWPLRAPTAAPPPAAGMQASRTPPGDTAGTAAHLCGVSCGGGGGGGGG
jgi:hypothetical protein